jgi:hypothetical protein
MTDPRDAPGGYDALIALRRKAEEERDQARAEVERLKRERTGWRQTIEENQRLREALEGDTLTGKAVYRLLEERDRMARALGKIAEAERLGYGTQRTYGQMATDALTPALQEEENERLRQALACIRRKAEATDPAIVAAVDEALEP